MIEVVPFEPAHWPTAERIYLEGIATGNATFETTAPSWDDWDRGHLPDLRVCAIDESAVVLGWAALSPVSDRCVYGGVAEESVYVAESTPWAGRWTTRSSTT